MYYPRGNKKYNILKQLTPLNEKYKSNLWGFDIETYGRKNNFYCATVVNNEHSYFFDNPDELINFFHLPNKFNRQKPTIFATNLKFDFFGTLKDSSPFQWGNIDFNMRNGRLITGRIGQCKFHDTLSFWNASVEKLGNFLTSHNLLEQSKMQKPDNFIKDDDGNILMAVKPRNKEEFEQLKFYNQWDAFISYRFAQYLQDSFKELGCKMKSTIASTAMDLYRRKYLQQDIFQEKKEVIEFIHKAYAGGDCHAYVRGAMDKPVLDLDINSMYPHLMTLPLPDTNHSKIGYASHELIEEYEGCCEAQVTAPKMEQWPFLIWKGAKDKVGNIMPVGTFKGYYTFLELREAIKRYGKESVKPLGKCIFYKRSDYFLKAYAEDLYKLRKEMKADGNPLQEAVKGLLNNLYGKFGQKMKIDFKIPYSKLSLEDRNMYINAGFDIKLINTSGPDHLKFWHITHDSPKYYPAHLNPIWATYITAAGRILINSWKRKVKGGCYYVDTDGIICPKKGNTDIMDSKEMGAMKIVGKAKAGIIVRPKTYFLEMDNETILKAKGFNNIKTVEDFINLLEQRGIYSKRFIQFSQSLRMKNAEVNEVQFYFKKFSLEDKKRNWVNQTFDPYNFQRSTAWEIQKDQNEYKIDFRNSNISF